MPTTLQPESPASVTSVGVPPPAPGSALFIPLKRQFFEEFADGSKTCEYRVYGPRWNERTCAVGRRVILSLGYGKQRRLTGVVVEALKLPHVERISWWTACYGAHPGPAMGIKVRLDRQNAPGEPRR